MTGVVLLIGAYIVGYSLLYLLARMSANRYKQQQSKGMLIMAMLLHMSFILASVPAAIAYYTLFTNMQDGAGQNVFYAMVAACAVAAVIHLWGIAKSVRWLYSVVR